LTGYDDDRALPSQSFQGLRGRGGQYVRIGQFAQACSFRAPARLPPPESIESKPWAGFSALPAHSDKPPVATAPLVARFAGFGDFLMPSPRALALGMPRDRAV